MMKLSVQQRDEMVRRYQASPELTAVALAAEYGITHQSLLKTLRRRNVAIRNSKTCRQLTTVEVDEFVDRYDQNQSVPTIARAMGRSMAAVANHLRARGVKLDAASRNRARVADVTTRDKIVEDYLNNLPIAVIEQRYSVTGAVVYGELDRRGISRRPRRTGLFDYKPEVRVKLVRAAQAGAAIGFLAEVFGCSTDAVRKVFTDEDIPIPRGRSQYRFVDRKGREHWMRSSWEVRTASWLDEQELDWDYEKESFDIDDQGHVYTPDFWIYSVCGELELIVDVKGWLHESSARRIDLFRSQYANLPFELWDESCLLGKGILDQEISTDGQWRRGRGGRSSMSGFEIARALRLYTDDTASVSEIATELGRSPDTVAKALTALGVNRSRAETRRLRSASREKRDAAVALYRSGLSLQKVSDATGISVDILHGEVVSRGINRSINRWTQDEEDTLRVYYDSTMEGIQRCLDHLPGRSRVAIKIRAQKLGLGVRRGEHRRALSGEQVELGLKMRAEGKKWTTIADHFGVRPSTLRAARKRYEKEIQDI